MSQSIETMPCVFCENPLEPAMPGGFDTVQPYDGGQVSFVFAYGSCKFDLAMGITRYDGLICDECAAKYIDRMKQTCTDMNGDPTELRE